MDFLTKIGNALGITNTTTTPINLPRNNTKKNTGSSTNAGSGTPFPLTVLKGGKRKSRQSRKNKNRK